MLRREQAKRHRTAGPTDAERPWLQVRLIHSVIEKLLPCPVVRAAHLGTSREPRPDDVAEITQICHRLRMFHAFVDNLRDGIFGAARSLTVLPENRIELAEN